MGRAIDALIAYRLLKLLVTPFNRTKAYKLGIIDDKGKVLIKSKDIPKNFRAGTKVQEARKAYTLLIRFVFNLKRLLSKVGIRGPIGSAAAAAIAFFRVVNKDIYNLEGDVVINSGDTIDYNEDIQTIMGYDVFKYQDVYLTTEDLNG